MEMIRAGPMGEIGVDSSEVEWDDKGRTKNSQINVTYDELIRSVQFGYLENGALVLSKKYGPSEEGDNSFRVLKLEDNEYVTGLSVVLGLHGGIRLLTVHTNRGKYGPIGRLEDKHLNDCKIKFVPEKDDCREFGGFFGSYNKFMVSSIGASCMEMFTVGPFGTATISDIHWNEKGRHMISCIYVAFDDSGINSIQFSYLENGAQVVSKKYGSSLGHYFRVVRLNHDEYVTGLSGVIDSTTREIHSLTFQTNQRKHGPFCEKYTSPEKLKVTKREIVTEMLDRHEFGGFFGSCSSLYLTSIGISFCPTTSKDIAVKHENC